MSVKQLVNNEYTEQLELQLIAVLIHDPLTFKLVRNRLAHDHIVNEDNKVVLEVVTHLIKNAQHVDQELLGKKLSEVLPESRKSAVLKKLFKLDVSESNLTDILNALKDLSLRRYLIDSLTKSIDNLRDISSQTLLVANEITNAVITSLGNFTQTNQTKLSSLIQNELDRIIAEKDSLYIPSGIMALDRTTSRWQPGSLNIIAGRPGMGKTSLAITFMINAVKDFGYHAFFISLENKSIYLIKQVLSNVSDIELKRIRNGNLSESELSTLDSLRNESFSRIESRLMIHLV